MNNIQKFKNNHIFHSPVFLAIFALAVVFFAVNVFGLGAKYFGTKNNKDDLIIEKEKLTAEHNALEMKIERLESDGGMDAALRDRYNVVKGGEQLAVIVEKPHEKTKEEIEAENHLSFWQRIKKVLSR